ncbi:MAG: YbjQ family protein [Anaerolineae bacterium]|nr:YbjQ family protein [Anaerolineae bacterium]
MDISMTSTTNDLPGYRVTRSLGIVRGITVRSRSVVGGKIHEYVVVCEEAREEAFQLMMQHAAEKGANAIVGVRYDATEMGEAMTEVLAYGTAVVVERS